MESERETGGNTCLDSILSNGDQQAILESMMTCGDPLLAVEAKKRLTALSLSTSRHMTKGQRANGGGEDIPGAASFQ